MSNASKVAHLRQIVCWALMASGVGMVARAQTPDGPRVLPPEQIMERELKGAETHSYRLDAQRNELLQVRVEQKGIDVVVKLADARGRMLIEVDSPNGTQGFEDLAFIINEAGTYTVDVGSLEANATKGKYTILRAAPRAATEKDRKYVRAKALSAEATALLGQSKAESYPAASAKFQEASRLYRETGDRVLEAQALSAASFISERLGEKTTSLRLLERALPLYRATGDKRLEAATLSNIATLHDALGAKLKAIGLYKQALPMFPVEDKRSRATILNNIGKVYSELGDQRTALEYYKRALPLRRAVADKGGEAVTLHNLGTLYEALGDRLEAIAYYNQALTLQREVVDQHGEAVTLNNLGNTYSALGDNQKALNYLNQALRLHERLGSKSEQANTLTSIGSVHIQLGEMVKALADLDRALPLHQGADNKSGEAVTRHYMGLVHLSLGEQQKSLAFFNQALPVLRSVGVRDKEADTLTGMGSAYSDLGDKRKALANYQQALRLFRMIGDKSGAAFTLANIGKLHLDLGAWRPSLDYYHRALPLHRATRSKRGEAYTLLGIGSVYVRSGNAQKALDSFRQALPLFRAVGDRNGEAATLNNLMLVWESVRNHPLAIFYGKQSVNKYQELRQAIRDLDKETRETYRGTVEETYKLLVGILIDEGRIAEAEQVLAMLKEEEVYAYLRRDDKVARELLQTASLTAEEREALQRYDDLADKITSIGKEFGELDAQRKGYAGRFPKQARYDQLKKQLADATATFQIYLDQLKTKFAREDRRVWAVDSGLQSLLKRVKADRTAIVSVIVDESRLHLIVTTADTQRAHTIEVTRKEVNQLVAEFRQALTDPGIDPRPAGQKLYDVLVRPIEADLMGIKADTILWSLDGALRYVPTAALWDREKGYLVERFASALLTLASPDALALPVADKRNWKALGVGVSQAVEGFQALKAVPDELDCIITDEEMKTVSLNPICLKGVIAGKKLLDEKFTRADFEDSLGKFPVVHIASHFHLNPGNDKDSFLLLGGGEQKRYTVENLRGVSLTDVELLVLSACNTATPGGEKANGVEIEGFGAVAQKMGAKAVLATLWSVADDSTRDLMVAFYRINYEENLTKTKALRQAQLTMAYGKYNASDGNTKRGSELLGLNDKTSVRVVFKKDYNAPFAHPYYWSSFILIGNWR